MLIRILCSPLNEAAGRQAATPREIGMTEAKSLSQVGWIADHGARSGRCRNDIYCLLANETRVLKISQGERFVCPECLKPLKEVPDLVESQSHVRNAWLMVGGGLAVTAFCLLVVHPVFSARHAVSVFVVLPSAQDPANSVSIAIPSQTAEIPLAARTLASPQNIAYRTVAPVSLAVALPNPAARRSNPNASPRALVSSTQNRNFSATPIAGGEPAFPESAESQRIGGLVRVTCRIETNGTPSACEADAVRGGHSFRNAIVSWLKSGSVRFSPILRHGQPVAEVQSWDIAFSPDL
jgi:hypothetical protein